MKVSKSIKDDIAELISSNTASMLTPAQESSLSERLRVLFDNGLQELHVMLTNSGTSALYQWAWLQKNVYKHKTIAVPDITYKNTITSLLAADMDVVVCPVDEYGIMIPSQTVELQLPVSLFGHPVKKTNDYGTSLNIDNCQGITTHQETGFYQTHTFMLSFDATKPISGITGGGAIITSDSMFASNYTKHKMASPIDLNMKMKGIDAITIADRLLYIDAWKAMVRPKAEYALRELKKLKLDTFIPDNIIDHHGLSKVVFSVPAYMWSSSKRSLLTNTRIKQCYPYTIGSLFSDNTRVYKNPKLDYSNSSMFTRSFDMLIKYDTTQDEIDKTIESIAKAL